MHLSVRFSGSGHPAHQADYFTQYPRGCSLYESDSRIICNPLKSTPMYMPAYK